MFQHILLAAEDSDHSMNAARMAGETARTMNSSSLCIAVTYPPVPEFLGDQKFGKETAARQTKAEATVRSLLLEVGNIPGEITTEVLEGPVVDAILKVSQLNGTDLILMGSRHRGPLGQAESCNHGRKIADHAPCPVMIVC
jgi:nucleotide-binding universal stress UspA family protein